MGSFTKRAVGGPTIDGYIKSLLGGFLYREETRMNTGLMLNGYFVDRCWILD